MCNMIVLLEKAFKQAEKLPEDIQDELVRNILDDIII